MCRSRLLQGFAEIGAGAPVGCNELGHGRRLPRRTLELRIRIVDAVPLEVEQRFGHSVEARLEMGARGFEAVADAQRDRFDVAIESRRERLWLRADRYGELL